MPNHPADRETVTEQDTAKVNGPVSIQAHMARILK